MEHSVNTTVPVGAPAPEVPATFASSVTDPPRAMVPEPPAEADCCVVTVAAGGAAQPPVSFRDCGDTLKEPELSWRLPVFGLVHVATQSTVIGAFDASNVASSDAVTACVKVWVSAFGGVAFVVGEAAIESVVVLRAPCEDARVPVSGWSQSL